MWALNTPSDEHRYHLLWWFPRACLILFKPIINCSDNGTHNKRNGQVLRGHGEQKRGPVSLGINLATGSTNRLSPPISRQHTDSYLYCQVAAAAAAAQEKRRDSSKKLRRIGTPVKQNAMQQDTLGVLAASEAWICVAAQCRRGSSQRFNLVYSMWKQCGYCR